jgi:PAS domain S-box-containing protein
MAHTHPTTDRRSPANERRIGVVERRTVVSMPLQERRGGKTDRRVSESSMVARLRTEAERIRDLYERLRESEQRFRTMADCAPVLLWMAGTDSLCNFFNKSWLEFSGRTMEEEYGNGWAEAVHAEDFQRCMHVYLNAFVERQPFRMEYRLRRHDGEYRWILDTGVPRFAPGGTFEGYIGSCIDITELRQAHDALARVNDDLELRVQQRTAALQTMNAELEQFAYIASHDLQAPLRAVSGYIGLLEREIGDKLTPDAQEFMRFITDGAQQMRQLIGDLLTYSRTSRQQMHYAPVDCEKTLATILESLSPAIAESGAKIEHGPLPGIAADATQVMQLLQNLIGNAIKFRGKATPVVRISAERVNGDWQFTVRDNGIGIAQEHQPRIFQVFHRLHTAEEYPGTGIGLAICKKVVERHGGRIWVESTPGQGSAFHFTLPAEAHPAPQGETVPAP